MWNPSLQHPLSISSLVLSGRRYVPGVQTRFLLLAGMWLLAGVLCAVFADHRGDHGDRLLCVLNAPGIAGVGLGYLMGPGHDPSSALFYFSLGVLGLSCVPMIVARSARAFFGLAGMHAALVAVSFVGFARYVAYCNAL